MKLKNIYILLLVAVAAISLMSVGKNYLPGGASYVAPASDLYRYDFSTALDTLTDAGTETFTIPALLYSDWAYNWTLEATEISGTTNLTCVIQEQAQTTGAWIQVGTVDLDGDSSGRVVGATVYGVKQRCVCTGTGTQSTQIDAYVVLKK